MAKAYINKYDIKTDHYIFDTTEAFDKFLSFSPGYLHVGYILKFNIRTGELIVGSNADNVSPAFFKELNLYRDKRRPIGFRPVRTVANRSPNISPETLSPRNLIISTL